MKARYLLFIAFLALISCKKNNSDPSGSQGSSGDFAYSVKYESVLRSPANRDYNFVFNIELLSGSIVGNNLTCFVEGLPSKVKVYPESIVVGHLLGGIFSFNIGNLVVGDYPFRLKIVSDKYGEQFSDVVLRITALPDFAPHLAGVYDSCYDYCPDSGFVYYRAEAVTVVDTPNILKISNIRNLGTDVVVRAEVSSIITIPLQSAGGKTIWGQGTYNLDARPDHGGHYVMSIKDTIVTGLDTLTCTMHIEH